MLDKCNEPEQLAEKLDQLAGDFVEQHRRGQRPTIEDFATAHPDLAEQIRDLFPALLMMERVRPVSDDFNGLGEVPASIEDTKLDRLGDFRILREVGRGGMGIVYEAEQISLGRHVALKVLPKHSLLDSRYVRRFQNEARAAARLHHTNIVPVFGVGQHEGYHYYIMQFIQGVALDEVLAELRMIRRPGGKTIANGATTAGRASQHQPALSAAESLMAHAGPFAKQELDLGDSNRGEGVARDDRPAEGTEEWHSSTSGDGFNRSSVNASAHSLTGGHSSHRSDHRDSAYWKSIARIGAQVADALEYAHNHGILHRDIKPANLLLDGQGTVWVTDFGLARGDESEGITRSGDIIGTMRYMSPEQLEGKADARSDIYSLGVTLYELLTLTAPHDAEDRARLMRQIVESTPRRPRAIDSRIPVDLETVVLNAISKFPAERYQKSAALAADLRRVLDDRPIEARRITSGERAIRWCRRNPVVTSLVAAVLLLATVLGIGAPIMHVVSTERDRAVTAERVARQSLKRAERAEGDVKIRAHLNKAAACRLSGQAGRRFKCLDEIRQAMALDPSSDLRAELRDEAIAAMVLVDLRAVDAPDLSGIVPQMFDSTYERYVYLDAQAKIHVRRVGDAHDLSVILPGLGAADLSLGLSPTSRYVVADHLSGPLQIWEVESGRQIFLQPLQAYRRASFSPDETRVAVSLLNGSVGVYELPSGRELRRLATGSTPSSIAFHPDGQHLAVGMSRSRDITIWEVEHGSVVAELPDVEGPIESIAWDPEGKRVVVGLALPYRAEVWDVASRQRIAKLEGHTQNVMYASFHPTGNLIQTASYDGTVRIWDAQTAREILVWTPGLSMLPSQDGRYIGFAASGDRVQLLGVSGTPSYRTLNSSLVAGTGGYFDGALSPDGRLLTLAMEDGVRFWDLASGREMAHLPIGTAWNMYYSNDGKELLSSGVDGLIRWPVKADEESDSFVIGPPQNVSLPIETHHAHVTLDGRMAGVSPDPSNTGMIVDLTSKSPSVTIEPHANMTNVVPSPDRQWAATFGWHSHVVKAWNARTGMMVKEFDVGRGIASFSPDSKQLITSTQEAFCFYEVGSWRQKHVLPREYCPYPGHMAFSPDGSVVALELSSAVISLVEVATGRTLARLADPYQDLPRWMAFTPDGRRLVVAVTAKAIHVWELDLIREELAAIGLDWEAPPFLPREAVVEIRDPPNIVADLGDLGPMNAARRQNELGRSLFDEMRWQDSINAYRRAIELVPDEGLYHNNYAWFLLTCPDPLYRDELKALEHAQKAIELSPNKSYVWNTIGVAYYRAGKWQDAIDALTKAEELEPGVYVAHNSLFIAMAHWQLGDQPTAREWYDRATAWLEANLNSQFDEELRRFRLEAEELMKIEPNAD